MNEVHLLQRLKFGGGIQRGSLFGGLFLEVGIGLGPGLVLGPCRSRIPGLHSLYIRSFSIIDGP